MHRAILKLKQHHLLTHSVTVVPQTQEYRSIKQLIGQFAIFNQLLSSNKTLNLHLVYNTCAYWQRFEDHLRIQNAAVPQYLQIEKNPFDKSIEFNLQQAVDAELLNQSALSHKKYCTVENQFEYVPFQRLAQATGLAYLHPTSHLCVHPTYGPWISLRAIIVEQSFDWQYGEISPYVSKIQLVQQKLDLLRITNDFKDPLSIRLQIEQMDSTWRQYRFSQQMLRYHYNKDVDVLRNIVVDQ
ncbi:hypothetical protein MP228_002452 [Amoeboaphelidium protococcarum]|nr:hypothetical protein MP228_002452 [Amoeboaphelidium protococcarum]